MLRGITMPPMSEIGRQTKVIKIANTLYYSQVNLPTTIPNKCFITFELIHMSARLRYTATENVHSDAKKTIK